MIDKEQVLKDYKAGIAVIQIAKRNNCSRFYVYNIINQVKKPIPLKGGKRKQQIRQFYKLMCDGAASFSHASKAVGMPKAVGWKVGKALFKKKYYLIKRTKYRDELLKTIDILNNNENVYLSDILEKGGKLYRMFNVNTVSELVPRYNEEEFEEFMNNINLQDYPIRFKKGEQQNEEE